MNLPEVLFLKDSTKIRPVILEIVFNFFLDMFIPDKYIVDSKTVEKGMGRFRYKTRSMRYEEIRCQKNK